jgi:hypothetical protein
MVDMMDQLFEELGLALQEPAETELRVKSSGIEYQW